MAPDLPDMLGERSAAMRAEPRVREMLGRLASAPPQVLLLEGGDAPAREAMARYWACVLNCPSLQEGTPCLACHVCQQMLGDTHRDLFFLDGSQASIKIDDVREVRRVLGEPPREAEYRMVILFEAQALGVEAANALLKSLEDPRPTTRFVLCAPQRERLLPTLVSRGWVVTLSWRNPLQAEEDATVSEWLEALANCAQDGRGWMSRTASKGALDRPLVQKIYLGAQRELLRALVADDSGGALSRLAASRLGPAGLRQLDEVLAEGLNALDYQVNPALSLDWLAVTLYRLLRG